MLLAAVAMGVLGWLAIAPRRFWERALCACGFGALALLAAVA